MNNTIIDKLAKTLYDAWKEEKQAQGYHSPLKCPNYERIEEDKELSPNSDLIHCSKCLSGLTEYKNLDDYQKNKYKNNAIKLNELLIENKMKLVITD